jgi:hypothetical protein
MFTSLLQGVGRLLAVLTIPLVATTAQAQWGAFRDPCLPCGPTASIATPRYAAAPIAYNPCVQQVSVASACPCMQPVTETVYREVPVTEYKAVRKTVKKPVLRTVYEDQPITAYRQEMEQRVAEVPTVSYQTVQECQPVTINNSHWQTVYQPVPKVSPCQYDPRPGLAGWANRTSYNLRMAFTPNQIRTRQFVPNVQTVAVPFNRTVAIPGTRQVTYNVAKMVPYETTQRVARVITDYEDVEVTAYEPHTVTKTVAVGNQTRWAFVDPYGGGTATASQPTPASRSAEQTIPKKNAAAGDVKQQSHEQQHHHNLPQQLNSVPTPALQPAPSEPAPAEPVFFGIEQGSIGAADVPTSTVAGWRASRSTPVTVARPQSLPAVAAN